MFLDSNAHKDSSERPLKDFIPYSHSVFTWHQCFCSNDLLRRKCLCFPAFCTRWAITEVPLLNQGYLQHRRSQASPSSFLVASTYFALMLIHRCHSGVKVLFLSAQDQFTSLPFQWDLFVFRVFLPKLDMPFLFYFVNRRPRIWRPAASCPECAYLDDETFNFCQIVVFRRESEPAKSFFNPVYVNSVGIKKRLAALLKAKAAKPFEKQKSTLHGELLRILATLPTPKHSTLRS